MLFGTQTSTPCTAEVMDAKPAKSTTMVWSTRRPDSFSMVFWVQAGLPLAVSPIENAELNCALGWSGDQVPSGSRQGGMSTSESRGIEMPTACLWSG